MSLIILRHSQHVECAWLRILCLSRILPQKWQCLIAFAEIEQAFACYAVGLGCKLGHLAVFKHFACKLGRRAVVAAHKIYLAHVIRCRTSRFRSGIYPFPLFECGIVVTLAVMDVCYIKFCSIGILASLGRKRCKTAQSVTVLPKHHAAIGRAVFQIVMEITAQSARFHLGVCLECSSVSSSGKMIVAHGCKHLRHAGRAAIHFNKSPEQIKCFVITTVQRAHGHIKQCFLTLCLRRIELAQLKQLVKAPVIIAVVIHRYATGHISCRIRGIDAGIRIHASYCRNGGNS